MIQISNHLQILLSAQLDERLTIQQLNTQLGAIQEHIAQKPLKVNIEVNEQVLAHLRALSSQLAQLKQSIEQANIAVNAANQSFKGLHSEGFLRMTEFATTLTANILTIRSSVGTLTSATGALQGVAGALAAITRALPAVAVISMIGFAVEKLVSHFSNAREEQEKLAEESKQLVETWRMNEAEILSLSNQFDKLSAATQQGSKFIDDQQEQEYLDIQTQLGNLLPQLINYVDQNGQVHLRSSEAIKLEIELMQELIRLKNEEQLLNAGKKFTETKSEIQELETELERVNKQINDGGYIYNNPYSYSPVDQELFIGFTEEELNQFNQNAVEIQLKIKRLKEELASENFLLNIETSVEGLDLGIQTKQVILELAESLNIVSLEEEEFEETIQNVSEAIKRLAESTDPTFLKDLSEETGISESNLRSLYESIKASQMSAEELLPVFDEAGIEIGKISSTTDDTAKNFRNLQAVIDASTNQIIGYTGELITASETSAEFTNTFNNATLSISTLTSVLDELNEGQGLSSSTIQTLMEKYEDLLPYLNDEIALREQIKIKILENERVATEALKSQIMGNAEYYQKIQSLSSEAYQTLAKHYKDDLENASNLAEAKYKIDEALARELASLWAKYYGATPYASDKEMQMAIQMKMDQGAALTSEEKEYYNSLVEFQKKRIETYQAFEELSRIDLNVDFSTVAGSTPSPSSKSGSKERDPASMNIIDSLIRQNQLQADLLGKEEELINKRIQIAQKNNDFQTQLEQTNLLLSKQQERVQSLLVANENLHQEANKLRSSASQIDTSNWFDHENKESMAYIEQFNAASVEQQEQMQKLFNELQKLKNAYGSNAEEVDRLTESIGELNSSLSEIRFNEIMYGAEQYKDALSLLDLELSVITETYRHAEEMSEEWGKGLALSNAKILESIESTRQYIQYLKEKMNTVGLTAEELKKLNLEYLNAERSMQQYNNALIDNEKALKNQLEKIANEIIDQKKDIYRKEQKLALDRIEQEQKALEKAHKTEMARLDERLKKYEEIVNARIRALDEEYEEEEFNRKLAKAQNERQDLLSQIAKLSLDNSYEAQAERLRLSEELALKEEEIELMMNDRTRILRKDALNKLLDDYRTEIEQKKETERAKYEAERERLERVREETNLHYEQLLEDEARWNEIREQIMNQHFDNVINYLNEMAESISIEMDSIGESITNNFIDKLNQTIALIQKINSMSISPGGGAYEGSSYFYERAENIAGGSGGGYIIGSRDQLDEFRSGGSRNTGGNWSADFRDWDPSKSYSQGGVVDYSGMAQVHGSKARPEMVLNAEQTGKLHNWIKNLPYQPLNTLPKISSNVSKFFSSIKPKVAILNPNDSPGKLELNFTFEKFHGTKNDAEFVADTVFKKFNNGIKKLGYKG